MTLVPPPPDWHARSACLGVEGVDFFPELPDGSAADGDNHGLDAKRLCATCPVWAECLTAAVDRREEFGIWGGAGGGFLRWLRAARMAGGDRWARALTEHRRHLDGLVGRSAPGPVTNRNGDGATHGLRVTYARGCRCDACSVAAARNSRRARTEVA